MPRAFSPEEMERTREELLVKGKELFIKLGYKKIGIRDLTSAVGIANGMFYKFFKSKEELLMTILMDEKQKVREKIQRELFSYKDEPIRALKQYFYFIMNELDNNPMMKILLLKDEYNFVVNDMSEEQLLIERSKSLESILEISEYWVGRGLIKDINMELVLGSLRSLLFLYFHRAEIGEDDFENIITFIIDRICDYVRVEGGTRSE